MIYACKYIYNEVKMQVVINISGSISLRTTFPIVQIFICMSGYILSSYNSSRLLASCQQSWLLDCPTIQILPYTSMFLLSTTITTFAYS